jgi:hypothetical protein
LFVLERETDFAFSDGLKGGEKLKDYPLLFDGGEKWTGAERR